MKIKIAENIRSFRKEHSMTQEQLAEALGVTVGAVYKWEAGLSFPEIRLIMEIADLFEVSVDVLLGYEQQSGNVDAVVARLEQFLNAKNIEEAVTEAEKALKKYPNHFKVVYQSAIVYQVKFVEDKEESALERSNELLRQSISMLYQNTNKDVSEVSILNNIAENYILAGKIEQALEILKQNNVCGINNSLIGSLYATVLQQPKEAEEYLVQAMKYSLVNILRAMMGFTNMYITMKDNERCMDVLLWLSGFLDSIKTDRENIAYTDKVKAALMTQCAILEASSGNSDKSEEYISRAYSLAKEFDDAPVCTLQGIRFFEGKEPGNTVFDDMGKTAMEAVENILYDESEASEADKFVRELWKKLKAEK